MSDDPGSRTAPHPGKGACCLAYCIEQTAAPTIVRMAVAGIAQAGVPDPDRMLRDLLVQAIDVCAAWSGHDPHPEVLDPTDVGFAGLAGIRPR